METIIGICALVLALVWMYYCCTVTTRNNKGGASRNTCERDPLVSQDGRYGMWVCGQIRPREWQCNCEEPKNGCLVLKALRSEGEPAEERADRRGAIAAQKARKRNGG